MHFSSLVHRTLVGYACLVLVACGAGNEALSNSGYAYYLPATGNYNGTFSHSVYHGPQSAAAPFRLVINQQSNKAIASFYESDVLIFRGEFIMPNRKTVCFVTTPANNLVTDGWAQAASVANISFASCNSTVASSGYSFSGSYFYTTSKGDAYPIHGGMSGTLTFVKQP